MPSYTPPLRDMQFVLHELLHVMDDLRQIPRYADLDADTLNAVLAEGGKFASEVLLPLNSSGDSQGCVLDTSSHQVTTPQGFKQAYRQFIDGGWAALGCEPAFGGQGLPLLLNQLFYEMLNSANQAWTMYPGLTHGAYAALLAHGTQAQQQSYLHKNDQRRVDRHHVTHRTPIGGTDLGLLRSKAEPQPDGSYHITGSKISLARGHDMAENIIHLVLARLPDAPPGIKGVSLFWCPSSCSCRWQLGCTQPDLLHPVEEKWASTATPPANWCWKGPAPPW